MPAEIKWCWVCGAETIDWDYLGDRRVGVCDGADCIRDLGRANRAMEEDAAYEAQQDHYSRYWGESDA